MGNRTPAGGGTDEALDREWVWRWPPGFGPEPLDHLLTSRANLRILRALRTEGRPCWPREIARAAGLSRSAVHGALIRLAEWKVIEPDLIWHTGRSFPQRLVADHPLVRDLARLFDTEWRLATTGIRGSYEPPRWRR